MGKLIKWLFGLVLLLVVLIGVAAVVLPMVIDPNDYKAEIVSAVKEETGRDLVITENLDLTVFPWVGITTGGVSLSNAKGFGDQPFAEVKQLSLRVKLMPLFSKQIQVDTLVLDGLRLNLAKNAKGQTNWDDLAGKEEKDAKDDIADDQSKGGDLALQVEGVQIEDAWISWDDKQAKQRYDLKGFRLVTGMLKPGAEVPVEAGFTLDSAQPAMNLVLGLTAQLSGSEDFKQINAKDLAIELAAKGEGLPADGVDLKLLAQVLVDLTADTLKVQGLSLQGPQVALSGDIDIAKLQVAPQVSGALKLAETNVKQLAAIFGTTIETTDESALTRISADVVMSHDGKALKLDPLTIVLDDSNIKGHVHVLNPEGPVVRSKLAIDMLNVDRYLPPASEEAAAEKPAASGGDPFAGLRKLDLKAETSIGKLIANKLTINNIKVNVVSKGGVLKAKPISADLYEGSFTGETTLDVRGKKPKVHAVKKLSNIEIGPLLKDMAGEDRLLGKGNVQLNLRTQGLAEADIRKSLNGTASFRFADGAFKGVNIAKLLRSAGGLLGQKNADTTSTDNQERTDFTEMSGSAKITNGVVKNSDLSAKSPLLRISGKGSVNLPADTIDYLLTTELVGTLEGQGGKGADKLTGVPIPVKVKGQLTSPSYTPDLGAVLESKAKEEIKKKVEEKVKEEIGDQLKGQMGDALKGLFGR